MRLRTLRIKQSWLDAGNIVQIGPDAFKAFAATRNPMPVGAWADAPWHTPPGYALVLMFTYADDLWKTQDDPNFIHVHREGYMN